jgi:hypothetical protein
VNTDAHNYAVSCVKCAARAPAQSHKHLCYNGCRQGNLWTEWRWILRAHFRRQHVDIVMFWYYRMYFFQKFVDFVPLCSQSASEVCQRSGDWISRLGIPVSAHSDYGPRFSSCEFDTFCKRYDRSFIVNHLPSSREWCCGKVQ